MNINVDRRPVLMTLGKEYLVFYHPKMKTKCKLIQVTKKGFNLLNMETSVCILDKPLYKSKCSNHTAEDETWFFINRNLHIDYI